MPEQTWSLHPQLAADTLLGILSHAALAVGLIAATYVAAARANLKSFLRKLTHHQHAVLTPVNK